MSVTRILWILFLGLALLVPAHAAPVKLDPSNFDLFVYRRSYTPQEKVSVRLSTYNLTAVRFSVYALDLPSLMPTSKPMEDFGKSLKTLDLTHQTPVTSWMFAAGKPYPNQWQENEVRTPVLGPGVYLIVARAHGIEKRTWLAITSVALLVKSSRQQTLIAAAQADTGQPIPNLALTLTDAQGRKSRGVTNAQGLVSVPRGVSLGTLWIYGVAQRQPAFALSSLPAAPDPFLVDAVTDRPIYRPGQTVQIKGTVHRCLEKNVPGGIEYQPFTRQPVVLEIRDATDALIGRQSLTTNAAGSYSASVVLGRETSLGHWQLVTVIGDTRTYGGFEVQAYRKPEYTVEVHFDHAHMIGGSGPIDVTISAQYFFGQPVANATVDYQINFQPMDNINVEPSYDGQGRTDAKGQLHLTIPTQRIPGNRTLSVSATLTDLSRRSQTGSGDMLVTGGRYALSLEMDKQVYHPGDKAVVTVHALDYDNKPVIAKTKIDLVEMLQDEKHRPIRKVTSRKVTTNASGDASVSFDLPRPGNLEIEAVAFDEDDNKIQATTSFGVTGDLNVDNYPTLNLQPAQASYKPGDVATVLLTTNLVTPQTKTVWALVTLEGQRLYRYELIPLTKRAVTLRVPLTAEEFPSIQLNVAIVLGKHVMEANTVLGIVREEQNLHVTVTPSVPTLSPGQPVTYTVTTKDFRGRPVSAEVALGVVDASIYAVQPDNTPNIEDVYYSAQPVRIQTDFSFAAQYSGGAYQTVPNTPPPGQAAIRVRRQFADTAYWNPFVQTNGEGTAQVTFTIPDNLTTWRATARGLTPSTTVGMTTQDTVSTMPLLVRLELPRFFVEGDHGVVSAIVHNYTKTARSVSAQITAEGAQIEGQATQVLTLAAGGQKRLDWNAQITHAASTRFSITADGGSGAQDAMELTLPTNPAGLKMVEARAEALSDTHASIHQDVTALANDATVTLTLSPSIAASMFNALGYLTSYPYGCAEQTTSAIIPDVIVDQAFRKLGVPRRVDPHLDAWVNAGLQRLYLYQHSDGGWNWWENDQTDGDMTAYVLSGLLTAKETGYVVDDQRLLRGTEALLRLLNSEQELSKRADWMLTLASARPAAITKPLGELYTKRDKLDAYGQASLCLALMQEGDSDQAKALVVAHELEAKASQVGTTVFWAAAVNGYAWRDDDVTITAHVLRALLAADPKSPRITPTVRWLMGNRSGDAWASTKSTAEAVTALTQYLAHTYALQPNYHGRVLLDGQSVQEITATPANAFDPPLTVLLTPEKLHGHTQLTVEKDGPGTLYLTALTSSLLPPEQAKPMSHGIHLSRTYKVTIPDPSIAAIVSSGSEIEIQTEIMADANYRYAMLEDPIPAGCEVVSDSSSGGNRQEVRDDKIVFFFDDLPQGSTFVTYRLRAETPGTYRILPGIASLAYFPEIRGNSGLVTVNIGEIP